MPIARNARVLLPAILAARRRLALQHLAVRRNAMPLRHGDIGVVGILLAATGRPGEVIAAHLDVVVGELAELVVVHAEQLGLLRGAEVQAGEQVDGVREQGGDGEGVGGGGDDVCDLDVHLAPVVVGEAAGDEAGVDAVEADDVVGAEEGVEEEADHAADGVLREDVEGVVDAEVVFD